ncbi:MAG: lipase maturation factor family protein [Chthoniobacterales bacterium]
MKRNPPRRLAQPPFRPLVLFDGDCHFCRLWIERWREVTGAKVDYLPAQQIGGRFPEITPAEYSEAVQFLETDGRVYSGAEAVFQSLGRGLAGRRWLRWCYEHVPGFAAISEMFYAVIARHRGGASRFTRLFWGDDVRRPTYFAARRGFLRTLGVVYLCAFISIWAQVDGLMGAHGIVPATTMLSSLREGGGAGFWRAPTICWWNSSDACLHALCLGGTLAAGLLAFGLLPIPALVVCFGCYLSLTIPGEIFFSYQWDILLLETGFVALFLAPWQWRLRRGGDEAVSGVGLFLAKALLFKLMFMSGVVKLTSGDPTWSNLTALDYHYWTQPLPTIFAWFADKNPEWLKKFCVATTLGIEVVLPFFLWAPRRLRLLAAWLLMALQLLIALTGNYCFFNLVTIALCLLLFDDHAWAPRRKHEQACAPSRWARWVPAAVLLVTLPLNLWLCFTALKPAAEWPRSLLAVYERIVPFRIVNGYGLFRVMTRDRPEIIFEGSADAFDWQPYEFKWKPGDLQRPPQWNAPHQPRLDWSMWFAALGSQRDRAVVERLAQRLLENQPAVLGLLARNPFPRTPPQFVRAEIFDYHFTTVDERRATGAWWKRQFRGEYLPIVSLKDFDE